MRIYQEITELIGGTPLMKLGHYGEKHQPVSYTHLDVYKRQAHARTNLYHTGKHRAFRLLRG